MSVGQCADVPLVADYACCCLLMLKMATEFRGSAGLHGYDLMNEPSNMPNLHVWPQAAQAAIDAIRTVDKETTIYLEGNNCQPASQPAGQPGQPIHTRAAPQSNVRRPIALAHRSLLSVWWFGSNLASSRLALAFAPSPLLVLSGSGASTWIEMNGDFPLNDPADRIVYSCHCYLDRDNSGTHFNVMHNANQAANQQASLPASKAPQPPRTHRPLGHNG